MKIDIKNIRLVWLFPLFVFLFVCLITMGSAYFYESKLAKEKYDFLENNLEKKLIQAKSSLEKLTMSSFGDIFKDKDKLNNILHTTLYDIFLVKDNQIVYHKDKNIKNLSSYDNNIHKFREIRLKNTPFDIVITPKKIELLKISKKKDDAFYLWLLISFIISSILSATIAYIVYFSFKKLTHRIKEIVSGIKIEEEEEEEEAFYEFTKIYSDAKKVYKDLVLSEQRLIKETKQHTQDNMLFQKDIKELQGQTQLKEINQIITNSKTSKELIDASIVELAKIFDFVMCGVYTKKQDDMVLIGSYAKSKSILKDSFSIDGSLIGEVYRAKKIKTLNYDDPLKYQTTLGSFNISQTIFYPIVYQDEVVAIFEFYFIEKFKKLEFLSTALSSLGINLKIKLDNEYKISSNKLFVDTLMDSTLEGLILLDSSLNVVSYNNNIANRFPNLDYGVNIAKFFEEEEEEEEEELLQFINDIDENTKNKSRKTVYHDGSYFEVYINKIKYLEQEDFLLSFIDITQVTQSNNRLRSQNDFIEQNVIFTQTDLRGIITEVSEAYEKLSGYSSDELIGKPHSIVRHSDMPSSAFKLMWETIQAEKNFRVEVKNRKKDGSYYWADSIVSPIFKRGKMVGYRSVRFDITKQKDLEEKLKRGL